MTVPATLTMAAAARRWDAVVIGAGPAGAVAARELARRGRQVLLVDKADFPRSKVCGCCLNGNALAALQNLQLGQLPGRLGAVPLTTVLLAAGGRSATLPTSGGVSLSRSAFDAALIEEAIRAGVQFLPGVRATLGTVAREDRAIHLDACHEASARFVVAADGLNGRVAAAADGFEVPANAKARIGAGVVLDHDAADYPAGTLVMATAAGGYVGLVRLEESRLDVAAAFDPAFVRSRGGLGLAACAILAEAGVPAISGLSDAAWKGTPALTRRPDRIAGPRWFAVGDAAGYVEPFTGEGMAWAISGASALADLADRAIGEWKDDFAVEWTQLHARLIGRRQRSCRILSRILRSPRLCNWLVRGLSVMPGAAVPVIRQLHRPSRLTIGARV